METEILIVHLNGSEVINNCLKSIYADDKNVNVHILLNNTTDESENVIKKFPNIKISKTKKLLGFAEASNFLAKKSKAKYIVFLNNDVVVEKNWLKELLYTVKRKNCLGVQSKILSFNDRNKFEYAGAGGGFIDKYGYPFCRGRIFGSIEQDNKQYDDEKRIFWGCGVCLLINRKDFFKFHGFDERLFMYSEELDFCWRVNNYGKEIWYNGKSIIYHIGNFSIGSYTNDINDLRKDYWITRNHLIVLLKNYSFKTLIKVLPARFILEIIAAIRFAPIRTISFLRSMISIPFFHFPHIIRQRRKIKSNRKISDKDLKELILQNSIVVEHFINKKDRFTELKI